MPHRASTLRRFCKRALSLALLELVAAPAFAQITASGPGSPAVELEEIVVTGTRAALVASRDLKRNAAVVQDSIVAEDLGRFPDDNVADSLSHIPGVTISRTHGGEGQYANIRGLGEGFSTVTLNDRILATDSDGREFAFDVLPAEVLYGADVIKSPQASVAEGAIGGSVNLSSARPLKLRGMHSSINIEGNYNDLSEKNGTKASAFFSKTFANDTFGVLVSAVRSAGKARSDALDEFYVNPDSPGEFDANNDGNITADESNLLGLCCLSFGSRTQDKKRTAFSGVLEWKPNDAVHLTLDGLVTRLDATAVGNVQSYYVEDSILESGQHRWSNVQIRDHWVTDMTVAELIPEISTITESRVVDTNQFGLNGLWQATEALTFEGDLYRSKSTRDAGGKDTFVVAGIAGNHTGTVHMNNNALPDISVMLEDGRDLASALSQGALGNADYGIHYIGFSGTNIADTVTGATFKGTLKFAGSPLNSIEFGAANTRRNKTRQTVENDKTGGSCQYCGMYSTTFASLGADVVRSVTLPNFMRNAGGSYPRTFVQFDIPAYLNALKALDGQINPATGEAFDSSLVAPQLDPVQSYDVDENTWSAFAQANFRQDNWFGNVGLRWVRTNTTAKTAIDRIVSFVDPTPEIPTSSPDITYSVAEPFQQSGSYSKLLPSLNVGYWLTDKQLLRVGLSKVMARPSLNQLAPTRTDNTLDRTFLVTYDGNADLKPIEANQADLSYEWYFNDKSILNAAVFYKDIKNFVTTRLDENVDIGVTALIGTPGVQTTQLYSVSRPINGDKAKVFGAELGGQYFLANGMGLRFSYTYTDTKSYIDGVFAGPLEGVSKSAYSVALLFENDRWNMQVAADHSGKIIEVTDVVSTLSKVVDPITWVTASVAYKVNERVTVSVEGKNLTDAYYISTLGRPDILGSYSGFETWGRTYILSAAIKF
jgi:iron complex outermembrane receptor protein